MAKGSHTNSILTGKDKYCYLTGETRGLEKHHIYFGAGLRQISDKHGFWVWRKSTEGQKACMAGTDTRQTCA